MTSAENGPVTVEVERILPADPARTFAAWTEPATLVRWFCGSKATDAEAWTCPREDGCYLIVMHGEGRDWPHAGNYLEVDPGRRLRFTWYTPSTDFQRSEVDVHFEAVAGGTRIRLRHSALPAGSRDGFSEGWTELLDQLADLQKQDS
ncbi:MAG TPA: SRPBCC domain-containing protein [Pseudomonadales bacterium]|nr:SRPBCC domain-containing protein [Pseudomonadales bacterium]